MKINTLLVSILMLLIGIGLSAQDISGQWSGTLQFPTGKLKIVFHISPTDNGYTVTMDSPNQGAKGIPVTQVTFNSPVLTLEIAAAQINYKGTQEEGQIKGTFTQRGHSFPLNLTKDTEPIQISRSEEVTFENKKAGITLAGTLTLPQTGSNFPVAVLITGSGKQNRDEELLGQMA